MLTSAPPGTEPLLWLTPSPLWESATTGPDQPAFDQPWLVELHDDDFVATFLGMLAGADDGPTGIGSMTPAAGGGTMAEPLMLYRPIHGRYYLVVGSLVCRRLGLPDHAVAPRGQPISFVVRRMAANSTEQAWLATTRTWVGAAVDRLTTGEEQHPMHSANVEAVAGKGPLAHLLGLDEPGHRQLHFGYVPVAGRSAAPPPLADPVGALADETAKAAGDDPRLMEFRLRIASAWSQICDAKANGQDVSEPSLFLLLDLRDWLGRYLDEGLTLLAAGPAYPVDTALGRLCAQLDVQVAVAGGPPPATTPQRLGAVLATLGEYMPLVTGRPHELPAERYDVAMAPATVSTFLRTLNGDTAGDGGLVLAALADANAKPIVVPAELAHAVVPRSNDPAATADRFVLRLVYEHEPCDPVLSKATPVVRFAGTYEPDAPARPIRIELPDPTHMRRFARGVAIDMPPALRNMLDRVTPKMLKDEPPDTPGQWSIGMICSFSLQIIMLVAFIVMFIFLILLNIVFWWLPFLRICFPVPMKKSASP